MQFICVLKSMCICNGEQISPLCGTECEFQSGGIRVYHLDVHVLKVKAAMIVFTEIIAMILLWSILLTFLCLLHKNCTRQFC